MRTTVLITTAAIVIGVVAIVISLIGLVVIPVGSTRPAISFIAVAGFMAGFSIFGLFIFTINAFVSAVISALILFTNAAFVIAVLAFIPFAIVAFVVALAYFVDPAENFASSVYGIGWLFIFACASVALSLYVSHRTFKGDEKFAVVHTLGVALGAIGGTRFYKADLTRANFTSATLRSTNFNAATLTQVCWKDTKKLDRARVGDSMLSDARVRELLITHNGYKRTYIGCNFQGANLAGANLNYANLKRADLGGAVLRQTNLEYTNLTEAQAIGADFTGASLTGACLEAWNIDSTTVLKNIDCGYVFLLEQPNADGNRERRPHNPDKHFQPGDFEKFFKEVLDTVQILIRGGVNPEAFQSAFQKIMQEHQITPDAVTGIEKKGEDVMLTIQVPEGVDKACVEQTWDSVYQARLEVSRTTALLDAEKRRADDLKEIHLTTVSSLSKLLSNLTLQTSIMSNSNNPNISVTAGGSVGAVGGGNVSNPGVMNLGTMSGNVINAINQLSDRSEAEGLSFKELLTQLQQAIESDADLPDTDKTDLLEQVQGLVEAKQSEEPAKKEGLVRKASKIFEATLKSLPETAKIVEACSKLLPMIFKALGFPG